MASVAKRVADKKGRALGSTKKGFWFRSGRGWYNSDNSPLRDASGAHVKEKDTPVKVLRDLSADYRRKANEPVLVVAPENNITIEEICKSYLTYSKANDKPSTFAGRSRFLFDFCSGLPPKFMGMPAATPKDKEKAKIHCGFARMPARELKPIHVQEWLDVHPNWNGGKRFAIQALKRAFSYAMDGGLISENPIGKVKPGKSNTRVTYFTPEQEEAIMANASPAFALALRVCIRTGARYGCEFAALTANNVHESPLGQTWVFKAKKSKTGKKTGRDRIIFVAPEIAEIVRDLLAKHPTGFVFRGTENQPWTTKSLGLCWGRLKKKLTKNGIVLDEDACMYSTRHTFAKRVLQGHWSGRVISFKDLADLMGNTVEVCIKHYTQWDTSHNERLWGAV